jgi:hypothetical protein
MIAAHRTRSLLKQGDVELWHNGKRPQRLPEAALWPQSMSVTPSVRAVQHSACARLVKQGADGFWSKGKRFFTQFSKTQFQSELQVARRLGAACHPK